MVVREAPASNDPGKRPLVLIVEDNRSNQVFLKAALEKFGMACDTAVNGEIAVSMAADCLYDLILMDCQMPVMDGYAASRAIRKLSAPHCAVPILALTANAAADDKAQCLDAGMNDYLAKPIMLTDLCQKISQVAFLPPARQPVLTQYEKSVDLLIREMHFTAKEARNLLDEFFGTIPGFIQMMDSALEEGNLSEISALAHQLKGASSNLRQRELQAASARLEDAAKKNSGDIKGETIALKALLTGSMKARQISKTEHADD
jgi:CheY-like chemotaxis protein/HPt (histidine-containing phosphotransfer) domain-containing protein